MITRFIICLVAITACSCGNSPENNKHEKISSSELNDETSLQPVSKESGTHRFLCYGSYNDSTVTKQILDSLVILNSATGKTVQRLNLGYAVDPGGHYDALKIIDMNFDRLPDLLVLAGEAPYAGPAYSIYLFDPGTDRFEEVEAEAAAGAGFNPEADSLNKTITVYIKNGPVMRRKEVYSWKNNKFILVEDFDQESAGDNDEKIKTTHRKLVNGKMKVVKVTKE